MTNADIPPHIATDIAQHGVVVLLIRKATNEPPVQSGWKPSLKEEEPPF